MARPIEQKRSFDFTVCCRELPVRGAEGIAILPDHSSPGGRTAVTTLLEEDGHRVSQTKDGPVDLDPRGVLLILGNANWFPQVCSQLAACSPAERPSTIVWQSEALPPPRAAGLPRPRRQVRDWVKLALRDARAGDAYTNYRRLQWLMRHGMPDVLLTTSCGAQEFLAENGVRATQVPFGFHPTYGRDLGLERDIDVLLLGTLKVRRRTSLIKLLRRAGVNVQAAGSWHDPALWGDGRTRLLNRAKILLNLMRHPGGFPGLRFMLGMANGALVISEPIYRPAPYVPDEHFVEAELVDLPDVIERYLSDVNERLRIAGRGHRFVTQEVTLERSVERMLSLVQPEVHVGARE